MECERYRLHTNSPHAYFAGFFFSPIQIAFFFIDNEVCIRCGDAEKQRTVFLSAIGPSSGLLNLLSPSNPDKRYVSVFCILIPSEEE